MNLDKIIDRFDELRKANSFQPRGRHATEHDRIGYRLAQLELFQLAQAICTFIAPDLQRELEDTRRHIMRDVSEQLHQPELTSALHSANNAMVTPILSRQQWCWSDIQISPEFTEDPHLTGFKISHKVAKRLKELLRTQIRIILQTVENMTQDGR